MSEEKIGEGEIDDNLYELQENLNIVKSDVDVVNEDNVRYPADRAQEFVDLEDEDKVVFLSKVSVSELSLLIEHHSKTELDFILDNLSLSKKKELLNKLDDDVLTDLLQSREDSEEYDDLLKLLDQDKRRLATSLLKYPKNSVGGRMTTDIIKIYSNTSVKEAIKIVRENKENTDLLSKIFLVDEKDRIIGRVRLRDLTFSRKDALLKEIITINTIAISAESHQEDAALLIEKYDKLALPVVNRRNQLIGVITHDVAMEIMQDETTKDIEQISAISGSSMDLTYLKTPIFMHIRRRIVWIITLAFVAIFSGLVIHRYEVILTKYFLLAVYMPMIVAAGGNTGGQAATMVIRAMTLGEFRPSELLQVMWKEFRIGIIIGVVLASVMVLQIFFVPISSSVSIDVGKLALTIAIGLIAQVTASTVLGAILPILAKMIKLDPAVVASPMITTLVDIFGLIIYFSCAKIIFDI